MLNGADSAAAAGIHVPKYPPIRSAWIGSLGPPASSSTSDVRAPIATSKTPGLTTEPARVTSIVPGSSAVPTFRNHSAPWRPTRPRWASVSTFWTSVGRPRRPRSVIRGVFAQWDGKGPPDPVDDGTRLPGDEALGGGHDAKLRAVEPDPSTFGHRRIDALAHITMDDHDDLLRPNKAGRKGCTVEYEVWRAGEEHPVLHAGRLAFRSVCDDEWPAAVSQECSELLSGRERSATVADQPGALDLAQGRFSPLVG